MIFKLCLLFGLFAIALGQEKGSLDDLISDVFSKPPQNEGRVGPATNEKPCNGGAGECVPYYLCVNGTINTDGSDLLDIRFGEGEECVDYFEQCCATGDVLPERPPNIPGPGNPGTGIGPGPGTGPTGPGGPGNIPVGPKPAPNQCGFRNAEGVGFRITGNTDGESEYGEFPWMVAILKEELAAEQVLNVYQCGGSLINPSVVLTAAHCVHGKNPSALKVRAGEWDTQTKNELFPHTDHDVQDLVVHREYYKGGLHNDVALLFLKSPVKFEQHISTVCLPPQDANFDHSRCFASGWGKDVFGKEGKYQVILKKIELPVVPWAPCQESLRQTRLGKRFNLHNSFICAGGEPGKDTCKGDGGSPLVCPVNHKPGHYYQAGIVAWGIGCGETGTPGVYVNVAKFRHWIDEQVSGHGLQSQSYII